MKNSMNEIIFNNIDENFIFKIEDTVLEKIDKMKIIIPHFCHLIPKCPASICCMDIMEGYIHIDSFYKNNLSIHLNACFCKFYYDQNTNKKEAKNNKNKSIYLYNLCCCGNDEEEPKIHNKNIIFKTDFNEEKNNNLIKFRVAEIERGTKYIPNYEKMELLVGLNKSVFKIIQSFDNEKLNLNIYCDNMDYLKTVGSIIKEYYQERFNFYEIYNQKKEGDEKKMELNKIQSSPNLNGNQTNDDIQFKSSQSTQTIHHINKQKNINIVEIELKNDDQKIFAEDYKNNINNIYFIYVYSEDLAKNMQSKENKIIWFILKENLNQEDKKDDNGITIKSIQEPQFKENKKIYLPNQYIKYQNKKDVIDKWRKIKL